MRPFRLGLTGSIGMGKSATAALFPDALREGGIDRTALKAALGGDVGRLRVLEAVVHPATAADRAAFLAEAEARGADVVVFDIPLLFETGAEVQMDAVAVVSVDAETQARRVLARPGMTLETLDFIRSRQMPDAQKRARARWVIPTDTPESARAAVHAICAEIRSQRHA